MTKDHIPQDPVESKRLQREADKIEEQTSNNADEIPLNQPFPEEFPQTELLMQAESQQPVVELSPIDDPPISTPPIDEPSEPPQPVNEKVVGGYRVEDLLASVDHPPTLQQTEDYQAASNHKVKLLIAIGTTVVILGLILLMVGFNAWISFLLMLVGAVAVIVSVFAPVGSMTSTRQQTH